MVRLLFFLTTLLSVSTIVMVVHADNSHHRHRKLVTNDNIFGSTETSDKGHIDVNAEHNGSSTEKAKEGGGINDDHDHDHSLCGIADPTVEEVANIQRLVSEYKESSRGEFRTNVTVPICFHVITTWSGTGYLSDEQLQLQVDALNVAFSSSSCCDDRYYWCNNSTLTQTCSSETGFRFEMRDDCTTRTANTLWYFARVDSRFDIVMKQTLRVGGPDVLNIYFQDLPGGLLGSSWFPWWIDDRLWRDGINMENSAIVGGSRAGYQEGDLLAHEVGHWLGLYHTFQFGCSPGEGVLDTNPEDFEARGCPIGRNSCPGGNVGNGEDPIHNFMDYTTDDCQFEFTQDQIDVMHVSHAVYRAGIVAREILPLENGVASEPLTLAEEEMQVYSYTLETAGASVTCVVSYMDELTGSPCNSDCHNGDADLYLRWGAEPTRFENDCSSTTWDSFESCTSTPRPDDTTLYVTVSSFRTFLDVTTTCSEVDSGSLPLVLANNTASAPVSLVEGATEIFSFPVLLPLADVTCSSSGATGNADLFLRFSGFPDIAGDLFDCSSAGVGSDEECTLVSVSTGTMFVSILATSSFSNLTVTCYEVFSIDTIALESGVASDLLSLFTDREQYYIFPLEFPDTAEKVTCVTVGSNGDADFVLQWESLPTRLASGDCSGRSINSNERCEVDVPRGASSLYILVFAYNSFSNLQVTCGETSGDEICLGLWQECTIGQECCIGRCSMGRCRLFF